MKFRFPKAHPISVAMLSLATLFGIAGSGVAAQEKAASAPTFNAVFSPGFASLGSEPLPQDLSQETTAAPLAGDAAHSPLADAPISAATLNQLVADQQIPSDLSPELKCLASAIYFEARSESLTGQLAVGRVIVNRSRSGRFPGSYCGVVKQPSQFSFVRGADMPSVDRGSHLWRNAVAVAEIANANSWASEAEGALYFHNSHVAPSWRLQKVARIDNHVFYR